MPISQSGKAVPMPMFTHHQRKIMVRRVVSSSRVDEGMLRTSQLSSMWQQKWMSS